MPGQYRHFGLELEEFPLLDYYEGFFDWRTDVYYNDQHEELGSLVNELSCAFEDERNCGAVLNNCQDPASFKRLNERVNSILQSYAQANNGDWRRYAAWSDHSYVRHLLWGTEEFELMVLCWKAGQVSRVHNHSNSHCWFVVLDGTMTETQYQPSEEAAVTIRGGEAGAIKLEATQTADLTVGDVAYINDFIALHSVGCRPHGSTASSSDGAGAGGSEQELACTLHLYCPPIRRSKAYENGKAVDCVAGFFSRHTVCRLPAPKPAVQPSWPIFCGGDGDGI